MVFDGEGYDPISAERELEKQVMSYLTSTGWVLTAQSEPDGYMGYLYVKDGQPLLLSTGRRMPIRSGVYVRVEYPDS